MENSHTLIYQPEPRWITDRCCDATAKIYYIYLRWKKQAAGFYLLHLPFKLPLTAAPRKGRQCASAIEHF